MKKTNKKQVLVSAHPFEDCSYKMAAIAAMCRLQAISESFLFRISRIFFENVIAIDSICSSHGYSGII